MSYALSTQGQGSSAYIALPNFQPNSSAATGGTAFFEIEYELNALAENGFGYVVGHNATSVSGFSLTSAYAVRLGVGTTVRVISNDGVGSLNRRDVLRMEYDDTGSGTTAQFRLYHKAGESGTLTLIGSWTGSYSQTAVWANAIGRSNANYNPITVYRVSCGNMNASIAANYSALWDETTAPGTGTGWQDTLAANALTITNATGLADSWWINYGGVTQHQSTSGTATQAATGTADTTPTNNQNNATAGSAAQSSAAAASTSPINGQIKHSAGAGAQAADGAANATPINNQTKTSAASATQGCSAQTSAGAINNQHRHSAGQLLSVAGFIANTSWVNTVDLGEVQHRGTSGSAVQSASAQAITSALNSQQRQSSGTAEHAATGNADTTASNSQHRQSAAELRSVAGFIASTSWVNTVDLGNIQHRGTSGSTTQAASAAATATATNGQNRQSSAHGAAEFTATASNSRVNAILQKAVYIRRIETQSISKKVYRTASRHKIGLKTQSGGGYMQELNFKQGASALLQIEHTIDNEPVSGISEAKYELYGRTGQVLVTKTLGEGIEFSAGLIEIELTENDTATLSSSYTHQCVARDLAGLKFYPLNGAITFGATKPRL